MRPLHRRQLFPSICPGREAAATAQAYILPHRHIAPSDGSALRRFEPICLLKSSLCLSLGEAANAFGLGEQMEIVTRNCGIGPQRVQWRALIRQERRIRRQNSVLRAERDEFVGEFLVLSVQVDLVDDEPHTTHGPQLLDEVVRRIRAGRSELRREFERRALARDLAAHADRRAARLAIAADPHKLSAFEQVGQIARIRAIDVGARELDRERR